jgi:hypothetical protein
MHPKGIGLLIFDRSKRKRCLVHKALDIEFWVSQIITLRWTVDRIVQFSKLYEMLQSVQLDHDNPDMISLKLANDACYSCKSAPNMQFLGQSKYSMPSLV